MRAFLKNIWHYLNPKQRLNIIYFVTASKTRSFSVSFPALLLIALFGVFLAAWSLFGIYWLGSSLAKSYALESEQKILQAELFKLQNADDNVFKHVYARKKIKRLPAQPTLQIAKRSTKTADAKPKVAKTPKKKVQSPVVSKVNIADLIPAKISMKQTQPTSYTAKVSNVSFVTLNNKLRVKFLVKAEDGKPVGGALSGKLFYKKIGQKKLSRITLGPSKKRQTGKYLFLATGKGMSKSLDFALPLSSLESLDRLELTLMSNNCVMNAKQCQSGKDRSRYRVSLKKDKLLKPLAKSNDTNEAG